MPPPAPLDAEGNLIGGGKLFGTWMGNGLDPCVWCFTRLGKEARVFAAALGLI